MAVFQFTATRSLVTGYTSGDTVTIVVKLRAAGREKRAVYERHVSIGGYRVTRLQRIDEFFNCQTIPLKDAIVSPATESPVEMMRMFMDSVIAGEEFTADLFSDAISSSSDTFATDDDYSESFTNPDRYTFDFRIVKIQ